VPAGPVLDLPEVLADPQVNARGLLEYVDYPGAPKPVPLAAPAMQLSATPGRIRHRAPLLGEHTSEVLGELGYTQEEIAALRAAQAV
jgi:crotonobetainyl-CoA:carnitine CoA-transferase CaiB-like acyl-CoA transferase